MEGKTGTCKAKGSITCEDHIREVERTCQGELPTVNTLNERCILSNCPFQSFIDTVYAAIQAMDSG